MDVFFFIDMVLQFNIAFPVRTRHNIMYITERKAIARHYLLRWFLIDFISVLPFDLLSLLSKSENLKKLKLLKVIRMLRLLKLLRLLKGMRIFERWQSELGISHRKLTLWQLLISVFVSAHWMSCALGMASNVQGDVCIHGQPAGCKVTWATIAFEQSGIEADEIGRIPPGQAYLVTLYTATTIIVHPHAFHPTGSEEHLVFILLLLLGGFVWTRVISRSTAISTSLDRHKIYYKQTIDDVNAISHELGLSISTRRQLRGFFMNTGDASQRETWQELTKRMSPQLRRITAREMNWPWVQRIPYLSKCSWPMITAIAEGLLTDRYAEHEVFGKPGHLYVLSRGLVSRVQHVTFLLKPGAVWGEDNLLLHCSYLWEEVTSVAQTFAEVLCMSRDRFEAILEENPENHDRLRKHYVKISVIRGVRYIAKQARLHLQKQQELARQGMQDASCLDPENQPSALDLVTQAIQMHKGKMACSTRRSDRRSVTSISDTGAQKAASAAAQKNVEDLAMTVSILSMNVESLSNRMKKELKDTQLTMDHQISAIMGRLSQLRTAAHASVAAPPGPRHGDGAGAPGDGDDGPESESRRSSRRSSTLR